MQAMSSVGRRTSGAVILAVCLGHLWLIPPIAAQAQAADVVKLPRVHEYQQQLCAYLATLTEKDFAHGVSGPLTEAPPNQDLERQYRNHILNLFGGGVPLVGSKRGVPAINNPSRLFLLSSIEGPTAILKPLVYPEALMQVTLWDYPGNVYHNNRALKLRCFVSASVTMMMLDDHLDKNPGACRADWRAYQLIILGSPYAGFKDLLPPEVQRAYQEGVKKLARRLIAWGPRGEEQNYDMIIPIGLWYAGQVCDDPALSQEVEDFARMMFTDPRYFHPAGYWLDRGGIDVGFAGQTNFFACWAALAGDWPFAREAVEKAYRLRAHLTLPEPDGTVTGPAAFNTRLCSPAYADQWNFGGHDQSALMLTDEAACWVKPPSAETLSKAALYRAMEVNRQIAENPVKSGNGSAETPYVYWASEDLPGQPWKCNMVENWNFPASMNYAYEFYRPGAYAHLVQLEKEKSPFLKFPFQRGETFVRDFAGAFVVARLPDYGVILHTGPVGDEEPHTGVAPLPSPLGFGGGQLSAFWTPATGSVILGRRGGLIHQKVFDLIEEWRTWPLHAVTGCTLGGKVFTSARIRTPQVASQLTQDGGRVEVGGTLPSEQLNQGKALEGDIRYSRVFQIDKDKLRIETRVTSSGSDRLAELYETIPVYLRDAALQPKATPTTIEFQVGGQWAPATPEYQDQVTAVKLTRFDGAVRITFDQPQRVKLSPAEWKDTVALAFGSCRNLMIDLMPTGGQAGEFKDVSVAYSIAAANK